MSIRRDRPDIFTEGGKRLKQYISKNITLKVQKAFALKIFQKCIEEKMGIIEAVKMSSKYTGYCPEVIRRWAATMC